MIDKCPHCGGDGAFRLPPGAELKRLNTRLWSALWQGEVLGHGTSKVEALGYLATNAETMAAKLTTTPDELHCFACGVNSASRKEKGKELVVKIGGRDAKRDLDDARGLLAAAYREAGMERRKISDAETVRKALRFFVMAHQSHQAYRIEENGSATPILPEEAEKETE